MSKKVEFNIPELNSMKKYPEELNYIGNLELLKKQKISFVGSRSPNQYARDLTHKLSFELSKRNICIVSGGAIGIDTIAHKAAGLGNTIMVAGTGLDKRYPAINKKMIEGIEKQGLVLSQFKEKTSSFAYNFPLRNELVVALGNALIVSYADLKSGTMKSVEYALKMNKKIYVFPHRIGESPGTNNLLEQKLATCIYDIDAFLSTFGTEEIKKEDGFIEFCKSNPSLNEALHKFGDKVYEYELNGYIEINNNILKII